MARSKATTRGRARATTWCMAEILCTLAIPPLVGRLGEGQDHAMNIEILLFDGFDELDAIAPYEVLAGAAEATGRLSVRYVTLGDGPVRAGHGTVVGAVGVPSEAAELLLVPGGGWKDRRQAGVRAEVERGAIPAAIAAAHARGVTIASVCTGAMLVAAAGILAGRPATTHHSALEDLRAT